MSDEIRHRILAAAARVYAQYGFRGATTRLIATAAGVNEVTLFRTFGSKAQLLQAMMHADADVATAKSMLMASMFGDALYRDIMPERWPEPVEDAPAKYVQVFAR